MPMDFLDGLLLPFVFLFPRSIVVFQSIYSTSRINASQLSSIRARGLCDDQSKEKERNALQGHQQSICPGLKELASLATRSNTP